MTAEAKELQAPEILDPSGRVVTRMKAGDACPNCGAEGKRVMAGFGGAPPICNKCGYSEE